MLPSVHAEILRRALEPHFSSGALRAIIKANLAQDALRGQFGHDEYHFDNNAFEESCAYIDEQRRLTFYALQVDEARSAWSAFGRLTHAAQDFYAHSNYVDLWLRRWRRASGAIGATHGRHEAAQLRRPDSPLRAPLEIDPVDPDLIASPELHSGKLYYPQEVLYFLPGLRRLALSILPHDSHAHMNLDSAERGPKFEFAFAAAVKRTHLEYERVRAKLSEDQSALFSNG